MPKPHPDHKPGPGERQITILTPEEREELVKLRIEQAHEG